MKRKTIWEIERAVQQEIDCEKINYQEIVRETEIELMFEEMEELSEKKPDLDFTSREILQLITKYNVKHEELVDLINEFYEEGCSPFG